MLVDDVLQRSPVFGVASPEARERLARSSSVRRYARAEFVFHQGDPPDAAYVMVDGRAKLVTTSFSGDELVLATLGAGDAFGELAALDGAPRSATAVTLLASDVLVIPAMELRGFVTRNPVVADAFLAAMAGLIRRGNERRSDLLFLDLAGRLAKHLLLPGTDTIELDVDQADLARMVGGSRQSLNAALRALQRRGIVDIDGRRVTIRDRDELRSMACQPDDRQPGGAARW